MLLQLLFTLLLNSFLSKVNSALLPEARNAFKETFFNDVVHDLEFDPETLEELHYNDRSILEGDMVLSTDRNALGSAWPTLEIPYNIHPDLHSRTDDITAAMAMISEQTCLSFHKRTVEEDYLMFQTSKGCASYVGFITGEQAVFIGTRCIVGNIVHEILHALGFHHEHTRLDREKFIFILNENILSGKEKNFNKRDGETFNLPYDIESILHYGSLFFSANGKPTIIAKTDEKRMGQRDAMTQMDIEKVRKLYHCEAFKITKEETVSQDDATAPNAAHNHLFNFTSGNQSVASALAAAPNVTLQALNSTSRGCDELAAC